MATHKGWSTKCVHAGRGPCDVSSSLTPPMVYSAPFFFQSTEDVIEFMEGRSKRKQPEYGRMGNPTLSYVESRLAAIEGAEKAQLFGSGMAAVTTLFLASLKSGDHLVITSDCYRRTRDFCSAVLTKFGVKVSVVDPTLEAIEHAVEPATRMVFTETPSNPYLYIVDIEGLVELGRKHGIVTVVDSTFATPINFRPLEFGADLVVHSATKYLGGHNDLIAGVLAGKTDLVQPVTDLLMTLGGVCDPHTAFLLNRGLKTLALRVAKHNANGQAVAEFLEKHPKVSQVFYPGLPSHPHHSLAKKLMTGFGGVVTFLVDGDLKETAKVVNALQIPYIAPSLGGVESLVDPPLVMSYWDTPQEERERLGIKENLLRLALGVEDADDLIADLDQALNRK